MCRRPAALLLKFIVVGTVTAGALTGCAPVIGPNTLDSDNGQNSPSSPAPNATDSPPPVISAADLLVGDCYNADDVGSDVTVNIVAPIDCTMPHSDEVYWISPTLEGDYPGQEALTASSSELCLNAFEPFIGVPFDSSVIAITILYVSPEEWAEPAKRHISCSVADMDSNGTPIQSTGTLQGAGR